MKIEIGESLIYSWLRHVKECQVVQTNWKSSPNWELQNIEENEYVMKRIGELFSENHSLNIFKETRSIDQLLKQAEIDALGINYYNKEISIYCVDIAFHENGLNYGSSDETISRIVKKTIRSAMCIVGYFGLKKGEIYFASPKTNKSIEDRLNTIIPELEKILFSIDWFFKVKLFCNDLFEDKIINPVIAIANEVADTSELFLRSIQLNNMFSKHIKATKQINKNNKIMIETHDSFSEMKIGVIARTILRSLLESNTLSKETIEKLQTLDYSKQNFDIQYPLLKKVEKVPAHKIERYYADPVKIGSKWFYLCSEWYEQKNNNDRPFLLKWLKENSV